LHLQLSAFGQFITNCRSVCLSEDITETLTVIRYQVVEIDPSCLNIKHNSHIDSFITLLHRSSSSLETGIPFLILHHLDYNHPSYIKGCSKKNLLFVILFLRLLWSKDLRPRIELLSVPHIIMGVLWGVRTRIFKIRDHLSLEIAIVKFQKGVLYCKTLY
jgi:hypothetical protein